MKNLTQKQQEKKANEILALLKGVKVADTVMILHTIEKKIGQLQMNTVI